MALPTSEAEADRRSASVTTEASVEEPSQATVTSTSTMTSKPCRIPWGGILALLGGFLIQLSLGSFYSFGNMMTYMTSYMR